jgi:hypothetical protein
MNLIHYNENVLTKDDDPINYAREEFLIEGVEDDFSPEDSEVRIDFKNFGRGPDRQPHFAVQVSWLDVRRILCEFIELEHPEALYLQQILQVAKAIEAIGWKSADTPEKEFWEILPESN